MGWPMDDLDNLFNGGNNIYKDLTGQTALENATNATLDAAKEAQDKADALGKPYADAGVDSLSLQRDLNGMNGPEAQAQAYALIQGSPGFQSQLQAGTNAILSNASATGGLRGGNVQGAMGQFAPALLSSSINDRYMQLGGITQMGQAAAAGAASSAIDYGNLVGGANAANYMNQYTLPKDLIFDTVGLAIESQKG